MAPLANANKSGSPSIGKPVGSEALFKLFGPSANVALPVAKISPSAIPRFVGVIPVVK